MTTTQERDTGTDLPVSERRLERMRRYIAERAPLTAKDRTIIVDVKALDRLLPDAITESIGFFQRVTGWFKRLFGGKDESFSKGDVKQIRKHLVEAFNEAAADLPFDARELEHEVKAPKRHLVMAAPDEITLGDNEASRAQVFREWFSIRHALVKAGAKVEVVPASEKGGMREVYTRDRYVMIGDTAYLPDPEKLQSLNDDGDLSMPERDIGWYKGEIAQIKKKLEDQGVKTVIVKDAWFEGGNVIRHSTSRTIFVGIDPPWSSEESARKLVAAVNAHSADKWKLLPVPLARPDDMYHLDTGMSEELPHGEVMISPRVTDKNTLKKIFDIVGEKNVLKLTNGEAANLASNMIDVGDTLVMTGNGEKLREKLQERGYKVIMPSDYGQADFEFGLGGVHCMTNDIVQPRHRKHALAQA